MKKLPPVPSGPASAGPASAGPASADPAASRPEQPARLRKAASPADYNSWKRFVDSGITDPNLDPVIHQSWQRCAELGVDPTTEQPAFFPSQNSNAAELILGMTDELEANILTTARDSGLMITITDETGCLVFSDGHARTLRRAERLRFGPGADWTERSVGTNAIGTALAVGYPVQIYDTEHFCVSHHSWRCTAAPFFAPSGRIAGCFDISSPTDVDHGRALEFVLGAARFFERRLLQMHAKELETWPAVLMGANVLSGHSGAIVAQAEGRICGADDKAAFLLGRSVRDLMHKALQDFFDLTPFFGAMNQPPRSRVLPVPLRAEGRPELRVEAEPLWSPSGLWLGILLRLHEPAPQAASLSRGVRSLLARDERRRDIGNWVWIGEGQAGETVRRTVRAFAQTASTVLVQGESGTGKELAARGLHQLGPRAGGPFVAVNCGAFAPELIQSELFGYEGGAFTGADRKGKAGCFERAQGGVLFLDEVSDLPLHQQVSLLRVLEERAVTRVGGSRPLPVNVKVVAACNRDLALECAAGRFRHDLFHRLNVALVVLPPLRDRPEDILPLARHHLERLCRQMSIPTPALAKKTEERLCSFPWPGNVRELINALEYACNRYFIKPYELLTPAMLPPQLSRAPSSPALNLTEAEEKTIRHALTLHKGNISRTAKALGIGRNTLYAKMRKLGLR